MKAGMTTRMEGWTAPYRSAAGADAVAEAQGENFDLLLGRRTYDIFAGYWPKVANHPIGDGLKPRPNMSRRTGRTASDGAPSRILARISWRGVRGVKAKDGPDLIVWGSSTLTSLLLEHGLVDEVLLFVYPVLLGQGQTFLFGQC